MESFLSLCLAIGDYDAMTKLNLSFSDSLNSYSGGIEKTPAVLSLMSQCYDKTGDLQRSYWLKSMYV